MIIIDTNILSTFAKIEKLSLLIQLNPRIPSAVLDEIRVAHELGYNHASKIIQSVDEKKIVVIITNGSMDVPASFGRGEKECIILAKQENAAIITNEKKVLNYCDREKIKAVSLNSFLRYLWEEKIQTKDEVRQIMRDIESKDRLTLVSKDEILE